MNKPVKLNLVVTTHTQVTFIAGTSKLDKFIIFAAIIASYDLNQS